MIKKLAKLANSLDKLSLSKEADIIDVIIKKIAQVSDEYDFPLEELNKYEYESYSSRIEPDIDHDVLKNAFAKIFNKYIDSHNQYIEEYAAKGHDVGELEERINPDDVEFEWTNKDENSFKSSYPQPYRWNVKNKSTGSVKEFDAWIEEEGAYPEYAIERVMGRDNDADKTPKEFIIYWEV
jgi:hypothetical protein